MTRPDWTLGVLLGGASSRMGRDKSLLEVNQETLLELVVRRCLPPSRAALLSVGATQRALPDSLTEFPAILDRQKDCGPLAGIDAMVAACETSWLVVIPCDMPGMTSAYLEALVSGTDGHDHGMFETPERLQIFPLAIRIDWARDHIPQILAAGRRRIVAIMENGRNIKLQFPDSGMASSAFRNINTQKDFDAFLDGLV